MKLSVVAMTALIGSSVEGMHTTEGLWHGFLGNSFEAVMNYMSWNEEKSTVFGLKHPNPANKDNVVPEGMCDNVNSVSGYYPATKNKKYWYWAFESRNDPENDPVVLWMTGGPGCSSQIALFMENGPCQINDDRKTTRPNPYSWNMRANMIYIDQPAGVGFSTGPVNDTGEWDVAPEMYSFLQAFFNANPNLRDNDFYVFGESYGGHYVPAVSSLIQKNNIEIKSDPDINLKGIGIGNGMVDPEMQEPQYAEYAKYNSYNRLVNETTYENMKKTSEECLKQISTGVCKRGSNPADCEKTLGVCAGGSMGPIHEANYNQYDVREKCTIKPLCYDFSAVNEYLNNDYIRECLGVETELDWEPCSPKFEKLFMFDRMASYASNVTLLLEEGIRVLVYAGEADYICNWMGNRAWVDALSWHGKAGMNAAVDRPFIVAGKEAGIVKNFDIFTFLTVHDSGHMVPLDQPEAALALFNTFIEEKSF
ncbi:hypothetical protein SARC_04026 [Sphaeroforma arctica JP610]|uniref:Carboxypeptidase n=1 Tax=Sphaeroforma arctica JP610 TaxID=667725 RepID=A0A0L0G3X9_9EUKA|nr:hypothetical protein SARC_04026 [Sphaeroforma arctica JP610]KNC83750.1 hypothetical protein SARC_04026 [Sphaeroforma arctica JP610]|eukprot:XP_014157652.1 hypothetical protein SARC_04026 [Sphaeroforma arctica JP610]